MNTGTKNISLPVKGDLPLLAKPGRVASVGGGVYDAAVETGIEEEEEVAGNLLENMEESRTLEI